MLIHDVLRIFKGKPKYTCFHSSNYSETSSSLTCATFLLAHDQYLRHRALE